MVSLFNKPYRETGSNKSKLFSILAFGLFIFLFLFIFMPFGLSHLNLRTLERMAVTIGFGLVTSCVLIVFRFFLEPLVKTKDWTLGKNILLNIFTATVIGAANYLYICIIFKVDFVAIYLFYGMWAAILIGSIPVTISYFIAFNKRYKEMLQAASIPDEVIYWEDDVTITAGNPRNDFKCSPKSIVYLCSNDNYVTIVTIRDNVQNKTTIRGTLKSAEEELKKNSRFVRCHKCYIVNLDYLEKVTGNNQNMKLKLIGSADEIPVARSRGDNVLRQFKRK